MRNWHCYTWYRGLKVKLPQCGSNFTRSWLPCEVNGVSGWWVGFWRAGIEHRKSFCKTNMDSLVFLAQSKLVAFYRKSWTFHDVPFRRLMLNDAQTLLTQRGPVFEINSTAYWARWLGGLWSIDLLKFVWFIALVSRNTDFADCHQSHTMCKRMNWRTSEAKLRWSSVTIGLSTQVWKWNCLSAPRRVPQLVDGLYYWRALNMKVWKLLCKKTWTDFSCPK